MKDPVTIHVSFSQHSGGYVATSKNCRGLFVSNSTITKVLESVPRAIKLLFKADKGLDVEVTEVEKTSLSLTEDDEVCGLEVAFLAKASCSSGNNEQSSSRKRVLPSAP